VNAGAPVTLDQIRLELRPERVLSPLFAVVAVAALSSMPALVVAGAWAGAAGALLAVVVTVAYLRAAVVGRLTLVDSTLTVHSGWRTRVVRLDRLREVAMWRGRTGCPTLLLVETDGRQLALSPWFWHGAGAVEAAVGVALFEHDDIVVTDRVASLLDDAAFVRFG
jgi:hypothetical protein